MQNLFQNPQWAIARADFRRYTPNSAVSPPQFISSSLLFLRSHCMAKEAKALFAKCPKCASTTARQVDSYKNALKATGVHSFSCSHCKTDYSVRIDEVSCGVIQQLTPQAHPLHVTN
jgi:hypothetical protein